MNIQTKREQTLKAIQHVFDVCHQNNGEVNHVSAIAEEYGVSKNIFGMALQRKGILAKVTNRSFILKTTQEPSMLMADAIIEEMRKIVKEQTTRYFDNKKNTSETGEVQKRLISISEIKHNAQVEARKLLIQATRSASILGIELMSCPDETISKYIESLERKGE